MFAKSDAWILLAIIYNHKTGGANLQRIIETADGINHAVLTYEELRGGLTRLIKAGLIVEQEHKYFVTEPVIAAYAKTHTGRRPVLRELEDMVSFLRTFHRQEQKTVGLLSQQPCITQYSYEQAIKSYLGK